MKRFCRPCGVALRMSELRCPYCRQRTVSWFHVGGIAALGVTAFAYLLRIF